MTIGAEDYALLAQDAYQTHRKLAHVELGGVQYIVLDEYRNRATGYQGTAYVRPDTGEVVIAHCGTDVKRMPVQDIATDAGMVLAGVNAQQGDALAFTKKAMAEARAYDAQHDKPFKVSVTGHSLGGTLAEITAYKCDLKGATFNAYGAAGLFQEIPKGGTQLIDYVRATDVVSAASPHFGEVHIYATPQDIDQLQKAGYSDDMGALHLRNPFKGIDLDAHGIDNFTPDNPRLGHSIISPENAALYAEHKNMIDHYRHDVLAARTAISADWEAAKLTKQGGEWLGHKLQQGYEYGKQEARQAGHWVDQKAHQAYDYGKEKAEQSAHWLKATGQSIEQQAEHVAQSASQSWHGFSQRLDHMLEAAKSGDWSSFRQDQQALAGMEPGRQLRESAVQAVNRQEHLAAQQAAMATQPQAAPQVYMR